VTTLPSKTNTTEVIPKNKTGYPFCGPPYNRVSGTPCFVYSGTFILAAISTLQILIVDNTAALVLQLSPSTITGLHQIVQAIQQYDYNTALAYHAHIVGGGSFTEISAFMPGVKSLIQTAQQLQVYIQ